MYIKSHNLNSYFCNLNNSENLIFSKYIHKYYKNLCSREDYMSKFKKINRIQIPLKELI